MPAIRHGPRHRWIATSAAPCREKSCSIRFICVQRLLQLPLVPLLALRSQLLDGQATGLRRLGQRLVHAGEGTRTAPLYVLAVALGAKADAVRHGLQNIAKARVVELALLQSLQRQLAHARDEYAHQRRLSPLPPRFKDSPDSSFSIATSIVWPVGNLIMGRIASDTRSSSAPRYDDLALRCQKCGL